MPPTEWKRLQHNEFGKEIRSYLDSVKSEDRELAGIVVDEINAFVRAHKEDRNHPDEKRLDGDLREVQYLQLYRKGFSIRVFFTISSDIMWMLALYANKRRTNLDASMRGILKNRLNDVIKEKTKR